MPRPRIVKNGKPLTIWIGEDLYLILKQIKKSRGEPMSKFTRKAIIYYLQAIGYQVPEKIREENPVIPVNQPAMARGFNPGNMETSMMVTTQQQVDPELEYKKQIFKKMEVKDSAGKITSFIIQLYDCFNRILDNFPDSLRDRKLLGEFFGKTKAIKNEVGKCPESLRYVNENLLRASQHMVDIVTEFLSGKKPRDLELKALALKHEIKKYKQQKTKEYWSDANV